MGYFTIFHTDGMQELILGSDAGFASHEEAVAAGERYLRRLAERQTSMAADWDQRQRAAMFDIMLWKPRNE